MSERRHSDQVGNRVRLDGRTDRRILPASLVRQQVGDTHPQGAGNPFNNIDRRLMAACLYFADPLVCGVVGEGCVRPDGTAQAGAAHVAHALSDGGQALAVDGWRVHRSTIATW